MMKMHLLIWGIFTCVFLHGDTLFAQIRTVRFEQLDSLQKIEKRNVVVFIHTDWCKFCQTMQNTTFKNDSIISKLNNQFYFIELNAELKKELVFHGHSFKYLPTGTNTGIHELAQQLGTVENQVTYPTLCFLNSNNEIIFQYNQFLNASDFSIILTRLK